MRLAKVIACVVAVSALFVSLTTEGVQLRKQNLKQLIEQSNHIIYGTVLSVSDGISNKGVPFTEVTVDIISSAKDIPQKSSEYTFRQFGFIKPSQERQEKRRFAIAPEGTPRWFEGESVIAFLYKVDPKTGLQSTVGQKQGKLNVEQGKLDNQFGNDLGKVLGIDQALLSSEEAKAISANSKIDAGVFMSVIKRLVAESRS